MVLNSAATRVSDPEAAEFVRFCYRRRRVGWPELYDEMCAVASRGLYRGYGTDDLASLGIGFSLFDMPSLAAFARRIVDEEQALRRPVAVVIAAMTEEPAITPPPEPTPTAPPLSPSVLGARHDPSDERHDPAPGGHLATPFLAVPASA